MLMLLVGCTAQRASTGAPSSAPPTVSRSPFATASQALITETPVPTASRIQPTLASKPTLTSPAPQVTPVSTLTTSERTSLVQEMLKTNGGCELPCWWGIVPGQTDWQALKNRFTAYGGSVFDVPHSTPPFDYRVTHSFVQQGGIVESIQVTGEILRGTTSDRFAEDWQRYSLDQVLTRYRIL